MSATRNHSNVESQTGGTGWGDAAPARLLPEAGLFMDVPLNLRHIMWRMENVHGSSRVLGLLDPTDGSVVERSFAEILGRAGRLAAALTRLGVRPGDRVGSLAWNDVEHVETYFGVMGMGAVLHTMNLRLHPDQLAYTVNHAADRVLIVDASLLDQLAEILPQLRTVELVIVVARPDAPAVEIAGALDYEQLLALEEPTFAWPDLDERSAASLCYTSGTTGDPKGVLYSHRAIVVHAMAMAGADAYGLRVDDRALALVPLFHAMGWGLPFVCGLVGADMVLPGRHVRPAPIVDLVGREGITWSAGVPTLWLDVLNRIDELEAAGDDAAVDLSSLRTVLCGGTAVPESLMRTYQDRFGVRMLQGWGMTEVFPGAALAQDRAGDDDDEMWRRRRFAGRISPLYQMRVVAPDGSVVSHDGESVGEIEIQGPAVASAYYREPEASAEKFHDGWLCTGDVGTIDPGGWLTITDRAKDVIKSAGEWISSMDLENALMGHPRVREAAVVGRPDERFSERPVAFVVVSEPVDPSELATFLTGKVPKWWLPEEFVVLDGLPRTGTGKFDKKQLRTRAAQL